MRALALAAVVALLAGCGGDGGDAETTAAAPAATAQLIVGGEDFGVGEVRVPFAVIRADNSLVQRPRATLIATSPTGTSFRAEATLTPIAAHSHPSGAAPHDHADVDDLYVAHLRLPTAGRYELRAEPQGELVTATGSIEVRERTVSPPVGTKAIPTDNPTLADGPAEEITTARPPDIELLRYSVADSIRDGVPFVVAFATPQHCTSRVCGPTVDVVENVRKRTRDADVRFIHVEIYEGNDPARGLNKWFAAWHLPSEPWVFLVDRDGAISAKFEGFVSEDELAEAVQEHLVS